MRKHNISLLLFIVVASSAWAFGGNPQWAQQFEKARSSLPAFKAKITETFVVADPQSTVQHAGHMAVTWGNDNATRELFLAYDHGKIGVTCPNFSGKDVENLKQDFQKIRKPEGDFNAVTGGKQGSIDRPSDSKPFWTPDALVGYYERNGVPYDIASQAGTGHASDGKDAVVSWKVGDDDFRIFCDDSKDGQAASWSFGTGPEVKVGGKVTAWTLFHGRNMPSEVVTTWFNNGAETKHLTSTISYLNDPVSDKDFEVKWIEGASVRDNVHHRIYRMKNGKLELDVAATESFNRTYGSYWSFVVFGFALALILVSGWFIRFAIRRLRKV